MQGNITLTLPPQVHREDIVDDGEVVIATFNRDFTNADGKRWRVSVVVSPKLDRMYLDINVRLRQKWRSRADSLHQLDPALIPDVGRAIVDCYEAARAAYPGVEPG